MNAHDRNMQMQLNVSVNLAFSMYFFALDETTTTNGKTVFVCWCFGYFCFFYRSLFLFDHVSRRNVTFSNESVWREEWFLFMCVFFFILEKSIIAIRGRWLNNGSVVHDRAVSVLKCQSDLNNQQNFLLFSWTAIGCIEDDGVSWCLCWRMLLHNLYYHERASQHIKIRLESALKTKANKYRRANHISSWCLGQQHFFRVQNRLAMFRCASAVGYSYTFFGSHSENINNSGESRNDWRRRKEERTVCVCACFSM